MKIFLGSILLAVAIAAPFDVQPLRAEKTNTLSADERRQVHNAVQDIRRLHKEMGYTKEETLDYLDFLGVENPGEYEEEIEKPITHNNWTTTSSGSVIENQQREGLLAAGYPNNAVEELLRLQDFAHPEAMNEAKVAKINAWHDKWDVVMMENDRRRSLKEQGYPDSAIDQYLALDDIAHPETMTEEKYIQLNNWHQHWDPVLQEHQIREDYRQIGYPENAIEEFLTLNRRINPDETREEKSDRINAWHAKWAPIMEANQLQKIFKESGYPDAAIEAYFVARDLSHPDTPIDVQVARMADWQKTWNPVIQQHQMRTILRAQGYSDEAIKERMQLDLDNANSIDQVGKAARIAQWERKWDPRSDQNQMRRSLREMGYSDKAIREFMMLNQGESGAGKRARIAKWESKWEPEMVNNRHLKTLRNWGYPQQAIDEFMALNLGTLDPNEETKRLAKQWEDKWNPVVLAKEREIVAHSPE